MKTFLTLSFLVASSSIAVADDRWGIDLHAGASDAITAGDHLAMGDDFGIRVDRERRWGRVGLSYGTDVEVMTYSAGMDTPGNGAAIMLALADYRVTYRGERFAPYASLGIGFADLFTDDDTDQAFAISVGAGLKIKVTKAFALGPYVRYTPTFEPALNQFVDAGISSSYRF